MGAHDAYASLVGKGNRSSTEPPYGTVLPSELKPRGGEGLRDNHIKGPTAFQ